MDMTEPRSRPRFWLNRLGEMARWQPGMELLQYHLAYPEFPEGIEETLRALMLKRVKVDFAEGLMDSISKGAIVLPPIFTEETTMDTGMGEKIEQVVVACFVFHPESRAAHRLDATNIYWRPETLIDEVRRYDFTGTISEIPW